MSDKDASKPTYFDIGPRVALEDRIPGEKEKAEEALKELPPSVRDFYGAQYQIIGSREVGEFVGLFCKCCNQWREFMHESGCSVDKLEPKQPKQNATTPHKQP